MYSGCYSNCLLIFNETLKALAQHWLAQWNYLGVRKLIDCSKRGEF
jgi:hypothetical protein